MAGKLHRENSWVVDSGATKYIIHQMSLLKNQTKRNYKAPMVTHNGAAIQVKGRREHDLLSGVIIKDVLHVQNFNYNLLSVSKLCNDLQCVVNFFPKLFVIHDLILRALIGFGECDEGLYKMKMNQSERKAMTITTRTWHRRLGHTSIFKLLHVDFIKNIPLDSKSVCDSCVKCL